MRTISPLRGALASAVVLSTMSLVGCGIGGGKTLVSYDRGSSGDRMTDVPSDGIVALNGSSAVFNSDVKVPVKKGDEVGFKDQRTDTGGKVVAVAGDKEYDISQGTVFDRSFYWQFKADK